MSMPVALTLWREDKDQLGNQVPRIRDMGRRASIITLCYHRLESVGGSLRTSRLQDHLGVVAGADYREGLKIIKAYPLDKSLGV